MLEFPKLKVPIQKVIKGNVEIFIKREDLIHPKISGNKYWKLYFNINNYLQKTIKNRLIITFGGAFSNHIASLAAFGHISGIPTMGIIRGEEMNKHFFENYTLKMAYENGMQFRFVNRTCYRRKEHLIAELEKEFPQALIIPEGGSNLQAIEGVKFMLTERTKHFDYLCVPVGTGGTIAGICKYSSEKQSVIGFSVVRDKGLSKRITELNGNRKFSLINADFSGYGKISDDLVSFINNFWKEYNIPLDPIYTGKMMMRIFQMKEEGYFPDGSKVMAFHTGGLQGIKGANQLLKNKNRNMIDIIL